MLHPADGWTIIMVSWAKRWQTSSIDTLGRRVMPTAESVSVPYSSPMFDVPDVSRFYRCSISDVHIGRSLQFCHNCCTLGRSIKHICVNCCYSTFHKPVHVFTFLTPNQQQWNTDSTHWQTVSLEKEWLQVYDDQCPMLPCTKNYQCTYISTDIWNMCYAYWVRGCSALMTLLRCVVQTKCDQKQTASLWKRAQQTQA